MVLAGVLLSRAQNPTVTVLEKVYTEAQAERGAALYEAKCAGCHEGDEPDAPPPTGAVFIERWREAPLGFLFNFVRTNMPGDEPGTLPESDYTDVIAYLLQESGYPAGTDNLTADKTANILLVGLGGPGSLPVNASVLVTGCLAGEADEWKLFAASGMTRVRVTDATTPDELAKSAAMPSGTAEYRLRNAEDFHADSLKGQRVQVKGVMTRLSGPATISVHLVERLDGDCSK